MCSTLKQFEQSDMLKRLPDQFFAKLTVKAAQAIKDGYDVINLGQGNPDQPTPAHIVQALQQAAENPQTHKYSLFRGYAHVREAIARFYQREYNVTLDPDREVAILFGGKIGLVEVSQCLLNPRDVALVPDPGYPDYWSGIAMAQAQMALMPLRAENGFLPDYRDIPKDILNKAKLMFLNYPNNPTAAVATRSFFEDTVALADRHHICVVHDFAYGALGYDGHRPLSFLQIPGAKETGIEIYTLSKTYNMAGWRVAFAVGNASVIESINLIQDHYFCSLFGGIQEAAAAALLGPQDSVRELVKLYESRRDALMTALKDIGWEARTPKGSFFVWLPIPKGFTSAELADYFFEQAHVVVAPGIGFGKQGEGYVRMGLVSETERLLEAVQRIGQLHLFA